MKAGQFKRVFTMLAVPAIVLVTTDLIAAIPQHAKNSDMLLLAVEESTRPKTFDASRGNTAPPMQMYNYGNAKYVERTSKPPPLHDSELALLPPCPAVVSGCPDLNYTGTEKPNCPDLCAARKVETYPTEIPISVEDPNVHAYAVNGSSKQAFCPPNYSAVGVFDMQPDLSYYSPGPTIKNIKSVATYERLRAAGYNCGGNNINQYSRRCKFGYSWDSNLHCPHDFLGLGETDAFKANKEAEIAAQKTRDDAYEADRVAALNEDPPRILPPPPGTTAYADKVSAEYEIAAKAAHDAGLPTPPPPDISGGFTVSLPGEIYNIYPALDVPYVVVIKAYDMAGTTCKGSCAPCGGWVNDKNFNATYQIAQCQAPPGYYPTNSKSPHATVCTRIKAQWKSLEAPN